MHRSLCMIDYKYDFYYVAVLFAGIKVLLNYHARNSQSKYAHLKKRNT